MRWPKFDAVEDARRVSPLSAAPRLRAARATILVVEDEVAVMRVVRSTLEGAGYTILTAGSVAAAEAIGASQIDLLLTDIALPDGNGVELVDRLRATAPLLRVLHMTGYAADTGGILEGSLLPKPFAPKQLLDKVAEILCCTHPEQGRLGSSSAGT